MFFFIFPVVVNVKNTVCVVGQFGGYFIVNTLIMYLIIPPSTTFSHAFGSFGAGRSMLQVCPCQ